MHILYPGGRIASGGAALIDLAGHAPGLRHPTRAVSRFRLTRWVADAGYRLVARNRHRLAPFVPDAEPVTRWRVDS
jgi:predicted DCC family thiol-disulfide oxidoreductase YuxK